jgi:hypothetical protein
MSVKGHMKAYWRQRFESGFQVEKRPGRSNHPGLFGGLCKEVG